MNDKQESAVVIEPLQTATHCIIWLHGLGADGHDFENIVPELGLEHLNIRFIFPHAPVRPVTINGGQRMRAWYDILSLEMRGQEDKNGIHASRDIVIALIEKQIAQNIPEQNIIVAGFSQGGAIALYSGLRFNKQLAGIIALSTYLPLADSTAQELTASISTLPIWMAHGLYDNVIPLSYGKQSHQQLVNLGCNVVWNEYDMTHSVCVEEIKDISKFILSVF